MAHEKVVSELTKVIESIDGFLEKEDSYRVEIRENYDRQLNDLQNKVEIALRERKEYIDALITLGGSWSDEVVFTDDEPEE